MALNLNGEIESKPGAAKREMASHFYATAKMKDRHATTMENAGYYVLADKFEREATGQRWKARGYSALAFIETAASKIGFELRF